MPRPDRDRPRRSSLERLLQLWSVPEAESPGARREIRLLYGVVRAQMVGFVALAAALLVPGVAPGSTGLSSAALLVVSTFPLIGALALGRRGRVAAGGLVSVVTAAGSTMASVALFGGLHGPVTMGLLLSVMVALVLRGWRAGAVVALACLGFALLEYALESAGLAPLLLRDLHHEGALATVLASLGIGAALLALYAREMLRAEQDVAESTGRALRSEQQLADVVRNAPDGIAVVRPDGVLDSVNAALERMTGYVAAEAVGKHMLELPLFSVGEARARMEAWLAEMPEQTARPEPMPLARADGTPLWIEPRAQLLRRADGSAIALVFIRDVTARVEAERARASLEAELREARRMESLGHLAGGVAHDFRNLLTPILANASLLRQGTTAEERAELTREIEGAARRANDLVGQLLAFARRQMLEVRVLDVNRLVRGLAPMLVRTVPENIQLRIELGEALRAVRADPGQLEQVIINLFANARDAMPAGGTLTIQTGEETDGSAGPSARSWITLAVCDTGEGISEGIREHLFEPFFTTRARRGGTGLGLATVQGIVGQAGGRIEVTSAPGRGSLFKVFLPAVHERPEELAPEAAPAASPRKATVLVVDDEELVRSALARLLRAAGLEVLVAADGARALEVARAARDGIELLVTDVVMPGMNGPELAEAIRELHPPIRTLFVSGYADQGIVRGGEIAPGIAFLAKPFSREALLAKISEILDGGAREAGR